MLSRAQIVLGLTGVLIASALAAFAQQPLPRTLILLDPGHGGPDAGARLADHSLEKDMTLALGARLRTALSGSGFSILSTRSSDPSALLTAIQRADLANHAHPTACLLLHATSSGAGVHIVTSALDPLDNGGEVQRVVPWATAQSASIAESLRLANELGVALVNAKIPVTLMRASVPPLDNITCPAVALELAPLANAGSPSTPVVDAGYQQHVAEAIGAGLASWRRHGVPAGAAR